MLKRAFEKISEKQWFADTGNITYYKNIKLPQRATFNSAAYDFYAPYDFILNPNEEIKIYSGIKCSMYSDEVLQIYVRSSMGIKHNIQLLNTIGIIDSDYFENKDNEGHIIIALRNTGTRPFEVKAKDGIPERIAQGIFMKYLTVYNDMPISKIRTGGIGSTN